MFNDFSARDVQLAAIPAALGRIPGKDFDNSNVFGPCIVTADSLDDPYDMTIRALVNGEQWSIGSTSTMGHGFERAISWLSQDRTIHAGEILGSGTVGGGCGIELGRRLNKGDVVECEVDGIGRIRNRVVSSNRAAIIAGHWSVNDRGLCGSFEDVEWPDGLSSHSLR